ncbi:MAG: SDR family oxidoreductase [Verrucomicrobia bacterium]|nr:SDR family oxidoreductase [Verrucomicrobiota bacterium]
MKPLENKVALVTGSSRGIGAATAKSLAVAGAEVVVNYAGNARAADEVVAAIRAAQGEALAVQADISKAAEVKSLFDAAINHFGRLDILVNNAGVILYKRLAEIADDEFDRLLNINVKGVFYTLREAATRLSDGGRIINLSSTTTRLTLPTYAAYVATKGAVEQMTRVFAKEVGVRGITVNVVSPGPVNTELFTTGKTEEDIKRMASMAALGRIGEPEDIARVVCFLASEEAGWISGQNLGANGGLA